MNELKHAELIRAALDCKVIQYRHPISFVAKPIKPKEMSDWKTADSSRAAISLMSAEYTGWEFRVKPEPKPDVIKYRSIPDRFSAARLPLRDKIDYAFGHLPVAIEKITFDGETGKVKSIELVGE